MLATLIFFWTLITLRTQIVSYPDHQNTVGLPISTDPCKSNNSDQSKTIFITGNATLVFDIELLRFSYVNQIGLSMIRRIGRYECQEGCEGWL